MGGAWGEPAPCIALHLLSMQLCVILHANSWLSNHLIHVHIPLPLGFSPTIELRASIATHLSGDAAAFCVVVYGGTR